MHFERQNFRIDCYKPKKHYGEKKLGLLLTKFINKDITRKKKKVIELKSKFLWNVQFFYLFNRVK